MDLSEIWEEIILLEKKIQLCCSKSSQSCTRPCSSSSSYGLLRPTDASISIVAANAELDPRKVVVQQNLFIYCRSRCPRTLLSISNQQNSSVIRNQSSRRNSPQERKMIDITWLPSLNQPTGKRKKQSGGNWKKICRRKPEKKGCPYGARGPSTGGTDWRWNATKQPKQSWCLAAKKSTGGNASSCYEKSSAECCCSQCVTKGCRCCAVTPSRSRSGYVLNAPERATEGWLIKKNKKSKR
jgi:hypothetical protein